MKLPQAIRRVLAAVSRRDEPVQYRYGWLPSRQAGVVVNQDTALTYSAVWACVRVISEDLAKLPWRVYQSAGAGKQELDNSMASRLLNVAPNGEQSAFSWRETLIAHALTWGNGYAEIERDNSNRPAALWPISPDRVQVRRTSSGALTYEISNGSGPKGYVRPQDMFHLHGLGFDGLCGYSVIEMARRAVGLGLAAEQFGADFFSNGTTASVHLSTPNRLSDRARANLQRDLDDRHKGVGNQFRPMVLEEGLKAESVSLQPADAQFIESRKFQVTDICRWYRVPPHKIADLERATFTNIEQQSIEYVTDCLMPWAARLEQEANRKLMPVRETGVYTKLNLNALMRGDSAARAQFYREMLNMGAMSPDEIRAFEDLDPIPGGAGGQYFMQMNMTTLDRIGEDPEPASEPPPPEDIEDDDDLVAAHTAALVKALGRVRDRGAKAKAEWARLLVGEQLELVAALYRVPAEACEIAVDSTVDAVQLGADDPQTIARDAMGWLRDLGMDHRQRTAA